jgi:hypothetical protein
MLSKRWPVLLTELSLLALVGLCGCSRSQGVVYQETRAEEQQPGDKVVRAVGDKEEKKDDPAPNQEGFRFPDDKGGVLLGRVLPPSVDSSVLTVLARKPRRLQGPSILEAPTLALAPVHPGIPRAALEPKRPILRPRLVSEETLDGREAPVLPELQSFPTGAKTREEGVDVNQPPPLPLLGQYLPDRASLEDPTTETSINAAMAATVPLRAVPVQFQRQSIPDPFENYNPVRLSSPPAEDSEPPLGPVRNPKQP